MVIDLPRVRRALSALDRIAAEHPELRQGSGRWADHLEELDRMTKPGKNRMHAYRARLAAGGNVPESRGAGSVRPVAPAAS